MGFHGATPTAQRANANQAAATDLASVITLANELRAALIERGLIKGSARAAATHPSILSGRPRLCILRIVPAGVEPVGVGFNAGAATMNVTVRLLRWWGMGAMLGLGIKSLAPRCGLLIRGVLSVLMLGSTTLAAPAQYQFRTEFNPDGTLTVYQGDACPEGVLMIPDTIDGQKVTGIGDYAFTGCINLNSITIPDSVTSIGSDAFPSSLAAAHVDPVNSSFSSVDGVLFNKTQTTLILCPGLKIGTYLIPDGVTHIGTRAFANCHYLTSVALPNSVVSIGDLTFQSCTQLAKIVIPDGVTSIGYAAFEGCIRLSSITIPDSVTSIGNGAFERCPLGNEVLFNTSRTMLVRAPRGITGHYAVPTSVFSIAPSAFQGCTGLTRIIIPTSVTSIGSLAFYLCSGLTHIIVPDSVTSIGGMAFYYCTSLTAIEVGPANPSYSSLNGILFNKSQTVLIDCPDGWAGAYVIPDSVTNIGYYAFSECTGLTNVTIPDSVTSIGSGAFQGCLLTDITIPGSVAEWADGNCGFGCSGTFSSCSFLATAAIREGVPQIPVAAFNGCMSLTNVTIPNSVTNIGRAAFGNCWSLTDITIPTGVTSIGDYAFAHCWSLTNVTIPDSVTSIGPRAFVYCRGLTNVTIGNGVTSIGETAFADCALLTAAYFAGDSPPAAHTGVFRNLDGSLSPATVYYLPGTKGWTATFSGRPTAPWVRPNPTILDFGDRFGPSTNGFSFVISWATNVPVVVEASADIGAGWTPISTNTLTAGWVQFTDPDWKSQPSRFYRVRGL